MNVSACAFDLGNTLSDDVALRRQSVRHVAAWLENESLVPSAEDFARTYDRAHRGNRTPFLSHTYGERVFFADALRNLDICDDALVDEALARYRKHIERSFRIGSRCRAALDYLRERGIGVALVSNESTERVTRFLEITGLRPLFDAVIVSGSVGYEKPHPEIFRIALRTLDTHGEDTPMFGDNEVADGACKELGMPFVEVTGYRNPNRRLKPGIRYTPDFSIPYVTPEHVSAVLDGLGNAARLEQRDDGHSREST